MQVKATAKYIHMAPRKVRLVVDQRDSVIVKTLNDLQALVCRSIVHQDHFEVAVALGENRLY